MNTETVAVLRREAIGGRVDVGTQLASWRRTGDRHGEARRAESRPGMNEFPLLLREDTARAALQQPRLERAINVIYRPQSERASHYLDARLSDQFDAAVHVHETTALEPVEQWAHDEVDLPETFPSGV